VALILPAFAKLNLTLDVVGRRPDGYHEIDSVMQTISLHDLIQVERTDCRVFDLVGATIEGENLVLKAARELEGRLGRALPFSMRLIKRIPMAAGFGGGSADAAAFLNAANQLYELKLTPADLAEIARQVGQDVPFFLSGGTARATGLGSTVTPLPALPSSWRFLVVCPPVQVSTRQVYEAVDGTQAGGRRTPALVEMLAHPPPRPSPARGEGDFQAVFGNDLEPVSRRLFPALDEAIDRLRAAVPQLTMTGTGAAFFAPFRGRGEGEAAFRAVRQLGLPAWLCRPVPAWA
jgi:4-diphosphocytidyl-2-C-methyl-D-erythritol kinase